MKNDVRVEWIHLYIENDITQSGSIITSNTQKVNSAYIVTIPYCVSDNPGNSKNSKTVQYI